MRTTFRLAVGAAMLAGSVLTAASAAHADTGGRGLYFVASERAYVATASHPTHRAALPLPELPGIHRKLIEQVVPSPHGTHLAEVILTGQGYRVVVTGANGRQAHLAFSLPDRTGSDDYEARGVAWRGEHRLYLGVQHLEVAGGGSSEILTARVSRSGHAGPSRTVRGSGGLMWPTVDPMSARLAGIRYDDVTCVNSLPITTTSSIVVLNLRTHRPRDLLTQTKGPADCPTPIEDLAWSPDGSQIAFTEWVVQPDAFHELSRIDVVAADGSDAGAPRIAVPLLQNQLSVTPTWQSAHTLWFVRWQPHLSSHVRLRRPDLYSVSYRHGSFASPHRRGRTARFSETLPSFG